MNTITLDSDVNNNPQLQIDLRGNGDTLSRNAKAFSLRAAYANTHHDNCAVHFKNTIESAHAAGKILAPVKEVMLRHKRWGNWSERNLKFDGKTADRYIKLAAHDVKELCSMFKSVNETYTKLGITGKKDDEKVAYPEIGEDGEAINISSKPVESDSETDYVDTIKQFSAWLNESYGQFEESEFKKVEELKQVIDRLEEVSEDVDAASNV